jgi:hypothetical protein
MILLKFDIWLFFEKSVENIQVILKSDKKTGHLNIKIYVHLL